jgi:serine/threonine protein kinase/tetratricopeptide (TPR) repeat protein
MTIELGPRRRIPPDLWDSISHALDAALELPEPERDAFIRREYKDNPGLLAILLPILAGSGAPDALLDRPAWAGFPQLLEDDGSLPFELPVVLADQFRLDREIGRGGMGIVFLGHDLRHDRQVAVKILRPVAHSAGAVARFLSEIRTTARLRHPNIVPLFDSGEIGDSAFFVMPYIAGESLRARLDRSGPLPVADAVRIASAIGDALAHSHAQGIVHRDVKPSNVLLSGNQIFLADFGIARGTSGVGGDLTASGVVMGTPAYMSPEQVIDGHRADARSDIYSLGAVLFEMLAGAPPYSATARLALATRATDPFQPLGEQVPAFAQGLRACIVRAMALAPEDRYQDVSQFLDALRAGAVSMPSTSGRLSGTFAGRYAIQSVLGRGATSVVYLASDSERGRPVAIKVLRPELAESMAADRFLREIRLNARLDHPHIVPVLDSGQQESHLFFVLPLMEGGTLRDRLERDKQLPLADALAITKTLAAALAHAHERGLIHRDVKPENILFTGNQACLSDFGIARALERAIGETTTTTGVVRGTPLYMSPEQLTGGKVDSRSDCYSLACVVYEVLAGVLPYVGSTPESVVGQKLTQPPRPLRVYRPSMPQAVEDVFTKALALLPADRFQSVSEFEEALEAASRAPLTAPYGVASTHASQRMRWAAAVTATIVVGVIAWRLTLARGASLDSNRVMVFPLTTSGAAQPATLGEDAATMIGSVLDGAGPLHSIDAWPLLPAALRDTARSVSTETAARIARTHQSGRYITGRIVSEGDSAVVFLELWATDSADVVARGRAGGRTADVWRLAMRSLNGILPRVLPPGAAKDATAGWEDRDPAAIASYLLGEAAYRRSHFDEALERYDDAVRHDSLFSIAAIRAAQAAMSKHQPDKAARFVHVAARRDLQPRYTHLVRGYQAYLDGRADSAVIELKAALREDPSMAVAWAQLGEVYTHLLPTEGSPDSLADDAFANALLLDSLATNVLYHPIQIALRRGDLARADPMLKRFLAAQPDTTLGRNAEIMRMCVRDGAAKVRWDELARARPLPLLNAAAFLAAGGRHLGCTVNALQQILAIDTAKDAKAEGRRWASLLGLTGALVAQGRSRDAVDAISAFNTRWGYGASLFLLAGPLDSAMRARAREISAADSARYGSTYDKLPYALRLWENGEWKLYDGNVATADTIARTLNARAAASHEPIDILLARSLNARLMLARGQTDKAIAMLRTIVPPDVPTNQIPWHEAAPAAGDRVLLARLLLRRGDYLHATAMADVVDSPGAVIHVLFLRQSLDVRLDVAIALGSARAQRALRQRIAGLAER